MAYNYKKLNAKNAYIWRIVHRDNFPWMLDNGLRCGNSALQSSNWVNIGNEDLIDRRSRHNVPLAPYGTLNDYIPFYFTPFSPMMYNIFTGRGVLQRRNDDIIILVSTLRKVLELGHQFLFTDRHAYLHTANYFNDLINLSAIDWPLLQARNFSRNPDDPLQIERYQAEALIYQHLPIEALIGVICYTDDIKSSINSQLQTRGMNTNVRTIPKWYFK